ncbi:ABC transporter substrate-binding protein [Vibrio sp.]|nr:ABC transporter substrate-binding protein [Vibrio sp.]
MKSIFSILSLSLASAFTASAADIKVAYDSEPVSFDPQEQLSTSMFQMSHMLFDSLVRYDDNLQFEARLATHWERVNDTTVRFKLRDDVTFHSGNPLTSKDVVWTFNRLKKSIDHKAVLAPFKEIKATSTHSFELTSYEPYPLFLNAAAYIFPMDSAFYSGVDEDGNPKDAIVKNGQSYASTHISGTGPFKVTSHDKGIKIVYERFEHYWDKGGNVDKLTLIPIKESATRTAALLSGEVDMISPVSPNDHKRIDKNSELELVSKQGVRLITIQMNQTNKALQDPKVRQAIIYAIQNEAIAKKVMRGFATPASQQWPSNYTGHNQELAIRFDPKKSKALLKEAGYADGLKLTMIAPNNRYVNDAKIAQAVSTMLAKVGISVDLKTMPKAQYWPAFATCSADLLMIGWGAETENFSDFLIKTRNKETGQGQYNCGHYSNKAVDDLVDASHKELDPAKRKAILEEIESLLYKDAAFVPLHWQNIAWGVNHDLNIKPIVNAMNLHYFGNLVVEQ